ncbi:heme A synthase [Microbacterium kribbense]|uniref:Heme A synthase n=1 Tax=Microbacterium kribbense TaxID=433645 RepID=A0ABP7GLH0_9MICO
MSTDLSSRTPAARGRRFWSWLPTGADRRVRVAGWISFITELMIIGTGGAVRLTGSGLGCEWPLCAPDSLIPVAGMGLHSYIEFGNRMMTGVVGLAALAVLILVLRLRKTRRDLWWLAVVVILAVLAQAVVGGITVLTGLNAGIVGFHFLASLALVATTAAFVVRAYTEPGPRALVVPRGHATLVWVTAGMTVLTLIVGVVTTASGPHSGDDSVVRHLLNPDIMAHVHSAPGYALLALTLAVVAWASAARLATLRWGIVLLAVLVVQIPVGIYQARDGLPALAVGVHMMLAGMAAAAMTVLVMRVSAPVPPAAAAAGSAAPVAAKVE